MRAQLEHLLAVAARPNVTIRIIPLASVSTSACAARSSCCASPARTTLLHVVFIEQRRGDDIFQDELEATANHGRLFAELEKRRVTTTPCTRAGD